MKVGTSKFESSKCQRVFQGWFLLRIPNYYGWWKKSCTSWYGKYLMIYRVLYIPGGAGFLPSTVLLGQIWFGTRLGQIDLHQLAIHILFGPSSSGNAMLCEKSKGGISPYTYISWTSLCRYLCQESISRDFNTLQLQHKAWPHHFQLIEELSRTPLTFNERIIGEDKFNRI